MSWFLWSLAGFLALCSLWHFWSKRARRGALFMICAMLGVYVGYREMNKAPNVSVENTSAATDKVSSGEMKSVEAVTMCDIAAERSMKNPSTFSTSWRWEERKTSQGLKIVRNFTASNDFGATLDHYYSCVVDLRNKTFVDFAIFRGKH